MSGAPLGHFPQFLEYKKEGLMVGYGPDKTDYYLMARIYK